MNCLKKIAALVIVITVCFSCVTAFGLDPSERKREITTAAPDVSPQPLFAAPIQAEEAESEESSRALSISYGMYIECACSVPEETGEAEYSRLIDLTVNAIIKRLKDSGVQAPSVRYAGSDTIIAEVPDVQDESIPDLICSPGKLEFRDPGGNTFMTNDMIETATYYYADGDHQIAFTLTDEGARIFADVTAASIGETIAIYLDGELLIAPTVQSAIVNGSGVINGLGSAQRAITIASQIGAPALPLKLTLKKSEMITDAKHAEELAARQKAKQEDDAIVIIRMGDRVVTKGEVKAQIEYYLNYYAYYAAMLGMSYDPTSPEAIAQAQEDAINALKRDLALTAKAEELGFDRMTAEEEDEIKIKARESYDEELEYIKITELAGSGLEGDELTKAAEEELSKAGITLDMYVESQRKTRMEEKLREYAIKDVTVSDEEIKAEYGTRVENDKAAYEEAPGSWADASVNGTSLYYTPAGVRRVKQILIKFREEDEAAISDAKARLNDATAAVSAAQAKAAANQEILETEDIADEIREMAEMDLAAAMADLAAANDAEMEATVAVVEARDRAFANIDAEADDILQQLKDGADWQTLMDEKNQDPGMKNNEKGYAVAAGMTLFDSAFVAAAMALEKPGDISPKTKGTSYGYYIIRYESDEPEGPVSLDDVKETVISDLLIPKQNEVYSSTVDQWVDEAGITVDLDALNN